VQTQEETGGDGGRQGEEGGQVRVSSRRGSRCCWCCALEM
jgi:hypothetical protein